MKKRKINYKIKNYCYRKDWFKTEEIKDERMADPEHHFGDVELYSAHAHKNCAKFPLGGFKNFFKLMTFFRLNVPKFGKLPFFHFFFQPPSPLDHISNRSKFKNAIVQKLQKNEPLEDIKFLLNEHFSS